MRLGKTPYGRKWHVLGKSGKPLCGYMSFSWAIEHEEVEVESIDGYDLCKNCSVKINGQRSKKLKGRIRIG